MAKISVRHGVARAYGFLFGRLFQVLGLSWLPAVFYAVAATYLIQRVSGAMQSAVPADAGLLGEYPFFYFLALIAVTAFLGAVIAVPLTRDALGLRDEPVAVHFVVGPREARMFFALLRFYAVEVVVLLVLAVAAGIGVSSAVRYADTQHLHLGWAGISLQGWLDIGAAVVAAAVFLMVASRLGFLLSPMAAAEKHVKLVRAGQLSRGNFWRIAFTYLIVGLPATLLLATCETTIGGLQMGKTLPSGMQAFYTVETGHIAIFAAILAGGLVALQALFAGASAAAYDELAEAAAYEAAPVEVETPAYREPVMAFADARPRDFGDARPGDHRSSELREDLASRAAAEAALPMFAAAQPEVLTNPVEGHDLRAQASASVEGVAVQPEEQVAAVEHSEPAQEFQAAGDHAETTAHTDAAAEQIEEVPSAIEPLPDAPPLDPVGAMAAEPQAEYTPPG